MISKSSILQVSQRAIAIFTIGIILCLVPGVMADGYVGGIPLTTVRSGTVSGGLYVDADLPSWGSVDVTKTFSSIPSVDGIQWARLYVSVYSGHMQNNYRGTANVSFDGNGDGTFESVLGTESLDTPGGYSYPGEGGTGPIAVNDHCNRVTSDYLMWYNVTPLITSQTPKARVLTGKTDGSFDGRIKVITLVVAYNDGDADEVFYWVNQGHDVDSYYADGAGMPYTGETLFDLSALSGTVGSATLTVNHIASTDGSYAWNGDPIPTDPSGGNSQGAFFGYNIWNLTSSVMPGESNDLSYNRTDQFYKIPLATLAVKKVPAPSDDLEVTLVNPVAGNVFARETNTVRITVRNNGPEQSLPTEVRLVASDGFDGRWSVPAIPAGLTNTTSILDTTERNPAGGTVTYTASVDPDDTIPETNEQNNQKSSTTKTVRYNGYKGARYWEGKSDILTSRTFDLRGGLLSSPGDSVYQAGGVGGTGWSSYTVMWTGTDLPIPAGASVREARLYAPYTWDDSLQIPAHFHLTFNGNAMTHEAHYYDQSNFGGYADHRYGLLVYNVTPYFSPVGNSAFLSKDNVNTNVAMYGLTLAVVYEDPSATRKQVFQNEGFDILGADATQYATTPEEATAYIPFNGMAVAPGEASYAFLTTFMPSGNGPEGDLLWNGITIGTNVWDYGSSTGTQVAIDTRDVKSNLLASGNEAGIRSTAGSTPLMASSHAFLVVEYPELIPVAAFTANVTTGTAPLSVAFTDQSTGTITSFAWDFTNDGTIDSTVQNPTYTYTSTGTYTVNLTVAGPGGHNSEVKTNYITVSGPSQPDLVITELTTNGNEIFAQEPNSINATVRNNGTAAAGPFTVRIDAAGAVYDVPLAGLDPGAQQAVQVTDTTLRNGGEIITITATADEGQVVGESNETNNVLSLTKTVMNNGYKGKRWTGGSDLTTQATFEGRYNVMYSAGDSVYKSAKWLSATINWTPADLPVPTGAAVVSARLYQPYSYNKMAADPAFTASYNGNTVAPIATYKDIKGYGSYNYPYGLYMYDVPTLFNTAGNTLILTPEGTPGTTNDYALYGAYLVVIYSDSTTAEKQIWINDEFDMIYAGNARSVTTDEATAYAVFAGIDNTDVASAEAITILASAGDTGKSRFFFNSNEYPGFWTDYLSGPQLGFSVYDVMGALTSGENIARLQSYDAGSGGDNMYAMNTILIVEKTAPVVTAEFNATPLSGNAPLFVQFTDASTGSITSYAWDFNNNGTVDSTEQNPTYTFQAAGTYTVNLTVTGPGGGTDSEVKTDYITASGPSQPDLVITELTTNGNETFAHEPNSINATVRNNGTAAAGPFIVRIDVAGAAYDVPLAGLDPWAQQSVQVTDTTLRTAGEIITISATADQDMAVAESDDTNNVLSITMTVMNNGYKGKRYTGGSDVTTQATFEGRVGTAYSTGDSVYRATGWTGSTVNWTSADLPIPESATILHARLYQGYTYDQTPDGGPLWTMHFNGQMVTPEATYTDRKGYGSYNNPSGLLVYNVTGHFSKTGNTLMVTPGAGNNNGLYGSYLVVVYQDENEPVRKIWINEECDMLYAGASRFTSDEEATSFVPFAGTDATGLQDAKVLAILFSANEAGKSAFLFNGQDFGDFSSGYLAGPQVTLKEFDVTDEVTGGDNTALFRSVTVGASGDNMVAAGAVFVTGYTELPPVAAFTANVTTGTAPLSVAFTDHSTGAVAERVWELRPERGTWAAFSTLANPGYTFSSPGTYDIRLTVRGPGGEDQVEMPGYISLLPPGGLHADFSASPLSGTAPLSLRFTDQSTGTIMLRTWDFNNDGRWDSISKNPTYTYRNPGVYSVQLRVSGPDGSDVRIKEDYITVTAPLRPPVARFTQNTRVGFAPLTVLFTDMSTGDPTGYLWNFGEGESSTEVNPIHTYTGSGFYRVTLQVSNTGGSSTAIGYVYVMRNLRPF